MTEHAPGIGPERVSFDDISTPLPRRLRDGLDRLARTLRSEQWQLADAEGLNPAQAHVLALLAGPGVGPLRLKVVARHLGVSQPSATDSVAALERKGLVAKQADAADARAIALRLTEDGTAALERLQRATAATEAALATLSGSDQAALLRLEIKLIRALQDAGAIPVQRMCASCRYFRPYEFGGGDLPHRCAFVNAAFGDRHLRLDCGEHEAASPADQAATWTAFDHGCAARTPPEAGDTHAEPKPPRTPTASRRQP